MQTAQEAGIETKVCDNCIHRCTASNLCGAPERDEFCVFVTPSSPACELHRSDDGAMDLIEKLLNALEEF